VWTGSFEDSNPQLLTYTVNFRSGVGGFEGSGGVQASLSSMAA